MFVGKTLTALGVSVSAELAAFSGWMLVGFAAILGLIVANLQAVSTFVALESISTVLKLFVVAVISNVFQRYCAAVIAASAAVGKEVANYAVPALDIDLFLRQIEGATLWPMRYLLRRSNRKLLEGDFAVGGRLIAALAQAAGLLVFVQMLAVVASVLVLANAIHQL